MYHWVPEYGSPAGIEGITQVPNGLIAVGLSPTPARKQRSYMTWTTCLTELTTVAASTSVTPSAHMIEIDFIAGPRTAAITSSWGAILPPPPRPIARLPDLIVCAPQETTHAGVALQMASLDEPDRADGVDARPRRGRRRRGRLGGQ